MHVEEGAVRGARRAVQQPVELRPEGRVADEASPQAAPLTEPDSSPTVPSRPSALWCTAASRASSRGEIGVAEVEQGVRGDALLP